MNWFSKNYDKCIQYKLSVGNVKILNGFKVNSDEIKKEFINFIVNKGYVAKRSRKSLFREWKAHNIMYKRKLFVQSTKDTDLNSKESIFRRIGYFFICLIYKE